MLIATSPPIYRSNLIEKMLAHPLVDGIRYNSGIASPYDAEETIHHLTMLTGRYGKKLWIDLKGRQLRIEHWAAPNYGRIMLNHEIEVDLPARIYFRGDEWTTITVIQGKEIFVDPPPSSAVGQGQAVVIPDPGLNIKGYSTADDLRYIKAAARCGISRFMLSFVEKLADCFEVENAYRQGFTEQSEREQPLLFLKIESPKGLRFVDAEYETVKKNCRLIAACDDLSKTIGPNKASMIPALKKIISADPEAIAASCLFSSLEKNRSASVADYSHVYLLRDLGYQSFMLSDGICWSHFDEAIHCWKDFLTLFPVEHAD